MKRCLVRTALLATAALSLGFVFMAYLNPHRALELANAFWACF